MTTTTTVDSITGTAAYFRFGALPTVADEAGCRVSRNHANGTREEGVSLYAGWITEDGAVVLDLRDVDAASALFIIGSAQLYRVEGTIAAITGSDGEPLLVTDDWSDTEDGWMFDAPSFPATLTAMDAEVKVVLS